MPDFVAASASPDPRESAADVGEPTKFDSRWAEAFRSRRAGKKVAEIAAKFGVDVRTVNRWIEKYIAFERRSLKEEPSLNLIADEVAKYKAIEQEASELCGSTSSLSHKRGFLNIMLKAMESRIRLLIDVGVLPKEPEKIMAAVQDLTNPRYQDDGKVERTPEEQLETIQKLLAKSRLLTR